MGGYTTKTWSFRAKNITKLFWENKNDSKNTPENCLTSVKYQSVACKGDKEALIRSDHCF